MEEDLLGGIVADFNAGSYRACVEPLEALYFDGRHPGHKGLLQMAVALLQLEGGLTSGPRYLLASARRLLEEAGPGFAGLDTSLLLERIEAVQRWLDSDKRGPRPEVTLRRASDRPEGDGETRPCDREPRALAPPPAGAAHPGVMRSPNSDEET